jgi:hypothetical protein
MEGSLLVSAKDLQELSSLANNKNLIEGTLGISQKILQELYDIRSKNDAMLGTLVVSHETLQELSTYPMEKKSMYTTCFQVYTSGTWKCQKVNESSDDLFGSAECIVDAFIGNNNFIMYL